MVICPSCGTENPERAKFCLECATALDAGQARPGGSRRIVTILFADVVGSTSLGEQLDPEALRGLLARYFERARTIVERHGGTIEKFIGDAIMAVFGIPQVHEDDALRAVRAAVELRDAIGELNVELARERGVRVEFRMGVNTGPVVAGSRDAGSALVTGDAVNVAARLEQAAPAGAILMGQPTFQLVRDQVRSEPAEPIDAKGKSQPVDAHLVIGMAMSGLRRQSETGFVGRRRELDRLGQAFEDSRIERRCHLFTLLGSAGVGKSRLINEFIDSVSDTVLVLRGRCLSYGEGITYWPIGEIVRGAAGIADTDDAAAARQRIAESLGSASDSERIVELVSAAIGLGDATAPGDELSWGIRRYLEELARPRGLVCVIEDIHWAEPALLDLIEHMADWTRDRAILLISTARPELLDARPTWGGGKVNSTTLSLEPLPAEATEALVSTLVENRTVPPAILQRILEAAEGNPLFAEEIIRMLSDDGVFERDDDGGGTGEDMDEVPIPTSVQAVIAARLDRLPPAERSVAEHAAVAGRVFERGAVMALVAEEERPDVARHLMALMRKELVHPDRAELTADDAFRFRHLLIRDTAYEALPKQQRGKLHERFAKWVEEAAGDRIAEYTEIVAYHYDQAQRYRRELGLDDSHSAALAELAGEGLAVAGKRAYNRGDMAAAVKLLTRAIDLMSPGAPRRHLGISLAVARNFTRDYLQNIQTLEELRVEADAAGDNSTSLKARLIAHSARFWSDPDLDDQLESAAREILDLAVPVFERAGDDEGLSLACFVEADIYLGQAQWQKNKAVHERGAEYAANLDPIFEISHRRSIVNAALWGPTPVPEYLALVDDNLRQVHSENARAALLGERALGLAMIGDAEGARRDIAEARVGRERQLGPNAGTVFTHGFVEYVIGDLLAAERALARADAQLAAVSETGSRSTVVGNLAVVRAELGYPPEEVRRVAELSRSLTTPDDAASNALWRLGLAWAAAMENDREEARRLIDEAETVGATTDFVWLQGFIQRHAGLMAELDGDRDEARERYQRAMATFEEKGDIVDADRARWDIERVSSLPA